MLKACNFNNIKIVRQQYQQTTKKKNSKHEKTGITYF